MDICLTNVDNNLNKKLIPITVHGMLWLQTHFENEQWEALSESRVIISDESFKLLLKDAKEAEIKIKLISNVSVLPKTN
tara:strand:+ start:163 stop:399 length:237 start_codon:yes stop_codon:yes gene_type:complete